MKTRFYLWLLLAVTAMRTLSHAAGLIVITDPPPATSTPTTASVTPNWRHSFAPLEMTSLTSRTKVRDQVAETTIEQEFYNSNSQQLEGTFLFPVPRGVQLKKFTMDIGGKQTEAELLSSDKARRIYEDIVRKAKDPALLEYAGQDVYKVRIFPILPNERKRITVSYLQLLKSEDGLRGLTLPLNVAKYSSQPIGAVNIQVDLESSQPLKSIYSSSHTIDVRRDDPRHARVSYEARNSRPDHDFALVFSSAQTDIGVNLMTYQAQGESDGYFVLLASPGVDADDRRVVAKDITFVLDTSGSMAGAKMEQARKALLYCIANLNDEDRFEVIHFASESQALFNSLTRCTKANRQRATEFVKGLKTTGGTAIDDALQRALTMSRDQKERPFSVIFLTDGLPTVGERSEEKIVAHVQQWAEAGTRVFCFGIGTDVNTHLLDKITENTRAFSQYVLPDEDIEVKLSGFFSKISDPVLVNLKLDFGDSIRVSKLSPSSLPDLFKGEQLVVAGRFSGKGGTQLKLEGSVNGERKTFRYPVEFEGSGERRHDFIPRFWATRRVGFLLDEIRLRGENPELKDEITDLARQYGIVTPYTAYLILEDEAARNVPINAQSLPRLQEDRAALGAAKMAYRNLTELKDGNDAVLAARYGRSLQLAENSLEAIGQGNVELKQRGLQGAEPATAASTFVGKPALGLARAKPEAPASPINRVLDSSQQSQFVHGRNFFQNGNQWTDHNVQNMAQAKRVRLQFGSPEYFEFAGKNPETAPWLALGANLQFAWQGQVYEVHE